MLSILLVSTTSGVPSSYADALSSNSPVFYRPNGYIGDIYYFQAIQITVSVTGAYSFTSNSDMDTRAYFYETFFDPSTPLVNLITDDDDSGDDIFQFRIDVNLQSGRTYILVVTTHGDYVTGSFRVLASGPASLGLMSITPSTSRPIITREFLTISYRLQAEKNGKQNQSCQFYSTDARLQLI
ncbi:unnamed protein product [Rotaria sp. Silwood1]|nr:unnamed protein product [Rotaria sp. Silwood1]CAF3604905.1 unnamed protein product [Rotaria sp. Silwood1]CAF3706285.1 unnamed protein product [Rotaria sp. Silwood1]CAF4714709.1 unnamed protein product [Rotaria sp. Silwood1]CAF4732924.1 unnamed protein product [Rotaria sp. Silwood1]